LRAAMRIETIARAVDREALLVQQLANPANQQHFMILVVPAIAAPLDRPQLRELLFPIAQHMRFHAAQFADFTDREVALRRNRRQDDFFDRRCHRQLAVVVAQGTRENYERAKLASAPLSTSAFSF